MANSKIEITFNSALSHGDSVSFKYKDRSIAVPVDIELPSEWRTVKYAKGHVQMTTGVTYDEFISALDYRTSFEADYNVPFKFAIILDTNKITIEGLTNAIEFSDFENSSGDASAVITNVTYTDPLTYTVEYLEATSPCADAKVRVTANKSVTSVTSPVVLSPSSTFFEFDWIRGVNFNLAFTDGTDNVSETETTPSVLETPSTTIVNKPSGATVLVSVGNTDLSFSPDVIIGNMFIFKPVENLQVSFLSKYVSKQFMSNFSSIISDNDVLDSYFTSDLNVVYEINPNKIFKSIVFSALVNNIFNKEYVDRGYYGTYDDTWSEANKVTTLDYAGYYPQATRNFLVGVTLKF